jgi:hypothetical protein
MDTTVRATVSGFEVDALLRSPLSPRELYFRVGLPQGAVISQPRNDGGVVNITQGAHALAAILPPAARDASGWPVPVAMRLLPHDTLALSVEGASSEYQYPIEVDPTAEDAHLLEVSSTPRGNWEFHSEHAASFGNSITNGGLRIYKAGEYQAGAGWDGYWGYQTKGNSRIWELSGKDEAQNSGAHVESFAALFYVSGAERRMESERRLSTEPPGEPSFGARTIEPPLRRRRLRRRQRPYRQRGAFRGGCGGAEHCGHDVRRRALRRGCLPLGARRHPLDDRV